MAFGENDRPKQDDTPYFPLIPSLRLYRVERLRGLQCSREMSPVFGYVMAFMAWTLVAALIWTVAAILSLRRRTRRVARQLFWATAGTYPGVFACQIVAAPVIAAALAAAWLLRRIVESGASTNTSSPIIGAVSFLAALFVVCFFSVMSLIGFHQGWRTGWAYGSGGQLRESVEAAAPVRWFRTLQRKVRA